MQFQENISVQVSLTPQLERFVREKVETGLYESASDVIRDALRHLCDADAGQRLARIRAEAAVGLAQAEQGLLMDYDMADIAAQADEELKVGNMEVRRGVAP